MKGNTSGPLIQWDPEQHVSFSVTLYDMSYIDREALTERRTSLT